MLIAIVEDIIVFLLGLVVGSFLNVVIFRLEQEKALTGRSECPHCDRQLQWHDLVPVLSFLWLQGKCRYCAKKISIQYPLVELGAALLFLIVFAVSGFHPLVLLFYFYIAASLLVIFVYDWKHFLIPDSVLFPAIIIAFLYRILNFQYWRTFGVWNFDFGILPYILAAILASGFFLIIYLISSGRWMGLGDVKLAILLGFLLGFPGIIVGLYYSFFMGAVVGLWLMLDRKKALKSRIPFAPFLILGTAIAALTAPEIINWYSNLILL